MTPVFATMTATLRRYARSRGIWLLMLIAPIGARFWVPRDDGTAMTIAVGGRVPVMTPAMVGLSLGIVVATSFLPVAWGYLRANVTSRRPWQIEDVTPASSLAMALGRFAADVIVLVAMLAALTVAGCLLVWLADGRIAPGPVALALWLVGLPPLICVAGLRTLFDALPVARRAPGDVLFFWIWLTMLVVPFAGGIGGPGFTGAIRDFAGFVRPLSPDATAAVPPLAIGVFSVEAGHVAIDVMAGLLSKGYVAARLGWCAIGLSLAMVAGLLYRSPRQRRARPTRRGRAIPIPATADAAGASNLPWPGLVILQMRAILTGILPLAIIAAVIGAFVDVRNIGSPATLLCLIFGLAREAGRWERGSLATLVALTPMVPIVRRGALIAAGTGLSLLMSVPAAIGHGSASPLMLALPTGFVAAVIAVTLASLTKSATVPRLALLVVWYGYFAS